jgi:two-component system sensor histidine kinase QseC
MATASPGEARVATGHGAAAATAAAVVDTGPAATSRAGYSLRRRIVAAATLAACVVWIALGLVMLHAVRTSSAREFDERLALQASVVLGYVEHEYAETGVPDSIEAARAVMADGRPEVVYQVWTDDARPVHLSADAPSTPIAPVRARGFFDVERAGGAWRIYSQRSGLRPLVVQVAEPIDHRDVIAERAIRAVLWPMLVALPLFALLVGAAVARLFRPLDRLATEIGGRSAFDLQPIDPQRVPRETAALAHALNSLILRQAEEVSRQQRFASHVAHELRTPLAALRMQAQVALRARDPAESGVALRRLMDGVDRTSRLVGQLLSLARADAELRTATIPLATVLDVVQRDLDIPVRERAVRLDLIADADARRCPVPEEPLYLVLRNLVENAVRHAPRGSSVEIRAELRGPSLTLHVADRGPGIPPDLVEAAFEPFRRLNDEGEGSGLGLAIVRRVVDSLDGRIELAARPGGGLEACVTLDMETHAARSSAWRDSA